MGSFFSSKQKTNSTQSTQVPLNFSQLMDRTISFANEGLDTPFQAYNAPRIAELSPNEQAGISAAGSQAGMYQPLIDMAMTNNADMQARGGVPTAGDLNQFINPYVDYVLGNSLDRLNEQSDTNMTKIGSTAAMQGAFGGTRHGVLEGANLAELLKSSRDLSASTYSDAYDKGMGNWFRSQDLRRGTIRDALDITGQGSAYNRGDIEQLMRTGLTGRTRDQSVLDFAFSEFMREQQDPFTKAGFASSILSSYPTNLFTKNASSTTTNTPSPFSQIAGVGMAAAGLMTGNPAALAGLGMGQQSLGMGAPQGGIDLTGPAGVGNGASVDDFMAMMRSRIPGFKKGGKVSPSDFGGKFTKSDKEFKGGKRSLPDIVLDKNPSIEDFVGALQPLPPNYRKGFLQENIGPTPVFDILDTIMGPVTSGKLPLIGNLVNSGFDGVISDENSAIPNSFYDESNSWNPNNKFERRFTKFFNQNRYDELDRKNSRENLSKRIKGAQYVDPQHDVLSKLWDNYGEQQKYLREFGMPEIEDREANAEQMRQKKQDMLNLLFSVPTDPQGGKFAKGGRVRKLSSGGWLEGLMGGLIPGLMSKGHSGGPQTQPPPATMVDAFNRNQQMQQGNSGGGFRTVMGNSILDYMFGDKNKKNFNQPQTQPPAGPYQPQPRPEFDWTSFYERQGLNRIPTAQSTVNPGYASGANRPDLSMFMQALQQRIGGQTPGGSLPTPPFQTSSFAEGGPVYLKLKPSTQGVKEFNQKFGFMPTDSVTDLDVPAEYLLDPERVFALALQKHESGSDKFDNPNYQARPIDKSSGKQLSSAFGIGQWILPTWNTLAQKSKGEIPSWTQAQLDKGQVPDKDTQDKAWGIWNDMLKNRYGQDYVARFASHQLGDNDYDKIRRASPNSLMRNVVGLDIAKNVSAKDKTVAQYLKDLGAKIDSAKEWEKKRLVDKGYNLTDRVALEGSDNPFIATPTPEKRKKYVTRGTDYLDEMMITPNKEKAYERRQKEIDRELKKDSYKAFRKDIEDAQLHRPNQETVLYPTNTNTRTSRSHKKAFEPLELFTGNDSGLSQYMSLIPYKSLPTAHRNTKEIYRHYPTEDERNSILDMIDSYGTPKGTKYKGGGYVSTPDARVQKFAGGGGPSSRGMNMWNATTNFEPPDWIANALERLGTKPGYIGDKPAEQTPTPSKQTSPFGNVNLGMFQPDNEGTAPEDFNMALEQGEPSDIVSRPAQDQLQEDGLTTALKQMIMQEIEDRKNRKEPGPPTLFGREINMPLLKMGLGILANSGYPNSAGEAIGKGVLGALNEEEQKQLDKSKRNNDKLKDLINLRYMQGMVESMDPNIKMQLQRERANQDLIKAKIEADLKAQSQMALFEAQRGPKLQDALALAKGKLQAENEAMFGLGTDDEGINID